MFCNLSVIVKIGNIWVRNVSGVKCDVSKTTEGRNVCEAKDWGRSTEIETPGAKHPDPMRNKKRI